MITLGVDYEEESRTWTRSELISLMREVLRVETKCTEVYNGMNDGPMYDQISIVELYIDGEPQ